MAQPTIFSIYIPSKSPFDKGGLCYAVHSDDQRCTEDAVCNLGIANAVERYAVHSDDKMCTEDAKSQKSHTCDYKSHIGTHPCDFVTFVTL